MTRTSDVQTLLEYTRWADDVMLHNAAQLSASQLVEQRDTLFATITGTFDHILLIAQVFRAHLEGREHGYLSRHRAEVRPFAIVAQELRVMNEHLCDYASRLSPEQLDEDVEFRFIGGEQAVMSRSAMLLHLANHATYHRGFVSTLLFPLGVKMRATDLTVFLRDRA